MHRLKQFLAALLWLVAAALIALGGAGIVAAMNFPPGTEARAELTWTEDQEAKAAIDAATDRLQDLSLAVEALGADAREALAAVSGGDVDAVNAAVDRGTNQLAVVEAANLALADAIERVPGVGADSALRISPEIQDRYDGLAVTTSFTADLRDDWALFTGRAVDAANLSALLAQHDQETAAAAQ
ncbi:MAG TPA: hypothetical protein VFY23_07365, partial [Candidatus Limnocylindrales bacterium]|nr:hypothetical protein [Candidatus Limnocylindrales bacterium]